MQNTLDALQKFFFNLNTLLSCNRSTIWMYTIRKINIAIIINSNEKFAF